MMSTEKPFLHTHDFLCDDTLIAFSTRREGGVGKGNYSAFNVNAYCGDSKDDVRSNRILLCDALGIEPHSLVMPHQTHDTVVRVIDRGVLDMDDDNRAALLEGVDAVMTDMKGICIGVSTADCIPVFLYDKEHNACCAVHAGWRGTCSRIVEKAIEAMVASYDSDVRSIKAVIGPGIGPDSFEVGDEVYERFLEEGFPMKLIAHRSEKWHIDLWECNRLQLLSSGLKAENINVCGIDTYTNEEEFFSARRLGIKSGRIFNGMIMQK